YSPSLVSASEIPSDQYALEFGAWKVKEESKIGQCKRPEKPIEIYEFEGCPFCRKVREMVTVLDLDVLFYPCPKKGPTFRPKVLEMGGKKQFPYMVDPNTGVAMYESDDIIKYLADTYGDGTVPIMLSLGLLTAITAGLATLGRIGKVLCINVEIPTLLQKYGHMRDLPSLRTDVSEMVIVMLRWATHSSRDTTY
ncbi:hypothetical protein ACJX0J_008632, partial [Zea mays]